MRIASCAALGVFLLALVAAATPPTASADVIWCWDDPVVLIGGHAVSISVGVYDDPLTVMEDVRAAHFTIVVPNGVSAAHVASTNLYFPEHVRFERRGDWMPGQPIPVSVRVRFEATRELPAKLKILYLSRLLPATTEDSSTTTGLLKAEFSLR
jgi:hypothetical protein